MDFTFYDYKTKKCTAGEYVLSHYKVKEVAVHKIFGTHFLVASQRITTIWKNEQEVKCNELVLRDLDNPKGEVLCKKHQFFGKTITAQEYLDKCLKETDIVNYIHTRCLLNDYKN